MNQCPFLCFFFDCHKMPYTHKEGTYGENVAVLKNLKTTYFLLQSVLI